MPSPVLWLVPALVGVLVALWALQLRTRDATTVDVAWTFLLGAAAVTVTAAASGDPWRRALVGGMAALWALRLGLHLLIDRVLARRGEDGRYRTLRARWGADAPRNFLLLYLFQGVLVLLFAVPIAVAARGGPPDAWAFAGWLVWVAAVAGESVADRQLAAFRADPANRGAVCRRGLWRYSRHPNYFFEWLHWWSYVLVAHGAPLTLLGPAAMLLFLFRVTGIPHTERQALESRGEAYREYQRTTSAFLPWPPRSTAR